MRQDLSSKIKSRFGGHDYCKLSERAADLLVRVEPTIESKDLPNIMGITKLALDYYRRLILVFDDWLLLLDLIGSFAPELAKGLYDSNNRGKLHIKKERPLSGINENELEIKYTCFDYSGLQMEAQNIQDAYAMLLITKNDAGT